MGSGDLTSAMRASLSAPGVFAPVERGGRLLVDGGISDNVPVDVARAMGVDVVIVVDVGFPLLPRNKLNSVTAISNQMLAILMRRKSQQELSHLGPHDILIRPALGDTSSFDFGNVNRLLGVGADAAWKMRDTPGRALGQPRAVHGLSGAPRSAAPAAAADRIRQGPDGLGGLLGVDREAVQGHGRQASRPGCGRAPHHDALWRGRARHVGLSGRAPGRRERAPGRRPRQLHRPQLCALRPQSPGRLRGRLHLRCRAALRDVGYHPHRRGVGDRCARSDRPRCSRPRCSCRCRSSPAGSSCRTSRSPRPTCRSSSGRASAPSIACTRSTMGSTSASSSATGGRSARACIARRDTRGSPSAIRTIRSCLFRHSRSSARAPTSRGSATIRWTTSTSRTSASGRTCSGTRRATWSAASPTPTRSRSTFWRRTPGATATRWRCRCRAAARSIA